MRFVLAALLTAAAPPPFVHSVTRVTAQQLPYSWRAGCPVSPAQLRRIRLTYWGFDGRAHVGRLDAGWGATAARSGAPDNPWASTSRLVPAPRRWSMHAYGKAIDVNPVENPYLGGGRVQPPAGRAYLNRSRVRPGMAVPGGVLVRAFASAGWSWGGYWSGTPDYQHFS